MASKWIPMVAAIAQTNYKTGKPLQRLKDDQSGLEDMPPMTMALFFDDYILSSSKLGKGREGTKRALRLERAVGLQDDVVIDENDVTWFGVEDADFVKVNEIIDGIEWQNPKLAKQLDPILEAILERKVTEKPKAKKLKALAAEEAKPNGQPDAPPA